MTVLAASILGAVVGFVAMLAARGRAGYAAALAILGLALGMLLGVDDLFSWISDSAERVSGGQEPTANDWDATKLIAGAAAAAPGVLGALFARRD